MDYFQIALVVLEATIRLSVPLILAALAGLFSERSGVFDIGLEGKMLAAAFAGGAAAAVYDSALIGLLAAIVVSWRWPLVHAFASITQRGNQIVSGVAINFIALGATVILGQAWFQQGGRTPQLDRGQPLPGHHSAVCGDAGRRRARFSGRSISHLISGHFLLTYFAFAMVPITWWVLFRTRFGLAAAGGR